MPKVETVGGFTKGDKVTTAYRAAVSGDNEAAEVISCWMGDDGSGEWVYVNYPTKRFLHTAGKKPCFGPFAFRPDQVTKA